ncbi:MAG: hypothetical protein BWY78_00701 [Alphaproteobacteria bacterium ADurb.Bin438]|nr:MAG: hypothetical protein BWY78_00701 [Alphaproteobacteria bacterium ADurb.Bin438]
MEDSLNKDVLKDLKSAKVFYECKDYVIVKKLYVEDDYKIIIDDKNTKEEHFPTVKNISKKEAELFIENKDEAMKFLKKHS